MKRHKRLCIKTGVDAYKRDLKKAQENVGTDGYLSEVVSQGFEIWRMNRMGNYPLVVLLEFGTKRYADSAIL